MFSMSTGSLPHRLSLETVIVPAFEAEARSLVAVLAASKLVLLNLAQPPTNGVAVVAHPLLMVTVVVTVKVSCPPAGRPPMKAKVL